MNLLPFKISFNVGLRTGNKRYIIVMYQVSTDNRTDRFLGETIHLHVNDWGRQSC